MSGGFDLIGGTWKRQTEDDLWTAQTDGDAHAYRQRGILRMRSSRRRRH